MIYINAASTVSHQPTFGTPGFSMQLRPLEPVSEIVHAPYKEYIDPVLLRRMSKVLRMSVAGAKAALAGALIEQPAAIIVGTGLGCLQDTEKFLGNFLTIEGLVPPTSFIQSTHNTIAGQISLSLGNHGYNMTHTQNTVSFEMALVDAVLKLEEGSAALLAGAADEYIPLLADVARRWGKEEVPLTSGASFFVLSGAFSPGSLAALRGVSVYSLVEDADAAILAFLGEHGLDPDAVDLVLTGGMQEPVTAVPFRRTQPYIPFSGVYATASAFAFHYAADYLRNSGADTRVLIVNRLNPRNLGVILIESVEA